MRLFRLQQVEKFWHEAQHTSVLLLSLAWLVPSDVNIANALAALQLFALLKLEPSHRNCQLVERVHQEVPFDHVLHS